MTTSAPLGSISEPTIVDVPRTYGLMVRKVVPMDQIPAFYDSAYQQVFGHLGQLGVAPSAPPVGISFSLPSQTLDLGAGVPVAEGTPGSGDVESFTIPASRALKVTVVGSFELLPLAYGTIQEWSSAQGIELGDLAWEQYMTMPSPDSDPAENVSDVYWLIKESN